MKMSYLTEVSTNLESEVYDYHLPHTKTIDLIGEEFAPRKHNVIVENIGSTTVSTNVSQPNPIAATPQNLGPNVVFVNANGTSSVPIQVQQLIQAQQQASAAGGSNNIVSVALATPSSVQSSQLVTSSNGMPHTLTLAPLPPSGVVSSSTLVSLIQQPHITTQGNHDGLTFTSPGASSATGATLLATSLPFNPVTVDLPHNLSGSLSGSEENGVLLCNLDELSKYIPENFYSDLCVEPNSGTIPISHQVVSMPDYLQTVVAGGNKSAAAITTTPSLNQIITSSANSSQLQGTPILSSGMTGTQVNSQLTNITHLPGPPGNLTPHPITIQLPTQPQPIQAVKTVTYVNSPKNPVTTLTGAQQPVRLAYTASGERITIQGFDPRFQVKSQPLLQVDPSKLTVLQELPEVGKVVIQETRSHSDSIANILEEMKSDPDGSESPGQGIEVTTAIPVAVTSLGTDPKKTTIKRVAAPASTVILPNKRSRNIIFAGNTLPQGAIPIQINGMNAVPLSAVKSLPATINLGALTPTPIMSNSGQVVEARKTRVEVMSPQSLQSPPGPPTAQQAASLLSKVNHNNNTTPIQFQKVIQTSTPVSATTPTTSSTSTTPSASTTRPVGGTPGGALHKTVGNNKTCNWVFENGEVCGKTFSKSYNLVVHMRMHEDVRPFSCSLCDQTFRQKAHLQRHETTHGLGSKVSRTPGSGGSNPKRKRKRSRGSGSGSQQSVVVISSGANNSNLAGNLILPSTPVSAATLSDTLQRRLAHVSEKFGSGSVDASDDQDLNDDGDSREDGVGSLRDEDIIEQVQPTHYQSQPIGLSSESGTIQIIVTSGANGIPTTLADMVSRMNHPVGGLDGQQGEPQTVMVTTSTELGQPGETIVIRNLDEHSPEVQKEIINALLHHHNENAEHSSSSYVLENARGDMGSNDNVKVEAEPAGSGAEMSPESLTAISGGQHHQVNSTSGPDMKSEESNVTIEEFMRK